MLACLCVQTRSQKFIDKECYGSSSKNNNNIDLDLDLDQDICNEV